MKKILRKMMSFVMAVFMVLQVMLPAFSTTSKAEEEKPNSIKGLEEMKDDSDVYFSILKSQEIYDKSKKKKDENKFSIAISMPDTTSQFRLIKRNDLKLYEDGYFDTNEKASKEYWRVKDMLNSQGLDLDLEIIKEDQGYKIVTKDQLEKLEEDENKNIYGQNYSYIDLKIMDDFDFNEKGIQKLFDEDKLLFNLEFIKYTSLDPDFELYEKDEKGNLKIKNQGDLFALIREDKIKLYNTNSLEEDYNKLKAYKEEKQSEQQKAQDKKEQENAPSQSQEEKVQDEKSSSNKENLSQDKKEQNNKEDTKENKESNTEVQVESKENTKENTENKDKKDSTQEPKKEEQTKKEEQKEESSQKTQTQEKSEDKKEKKTTEKKGLMPKLRMLFLGQGEPAKPKLAKLEANALADKKFTIRTRFDTSNAGGPIKEGQYFIIHLDKKLKVNDQSSLKPIEYNGKVIATPSYNGTDKTITYKITRDITEKIQVQLKIPVDYDTSNITDDSFDTDGLMTITNSVSGLGVKDPKNLVPQKIDKNGNPAGSIIEPDRDDVIKVIDDKNGNYQVPIDITGDPVVENGEMVGINWNMRVHADQSLSALGFVANFTTVEGSGLGEIESVLLNGEKVEATNQLENALGIVNSKHHKVTENIQDASYSFYTPVTNKQEKYMVDVSVFLKSKGKTGAVRFVLDQGWPKEKIEEATPTRVGINNRTTIQGKFLANDKAQWTITDAISSGDEENGGMPLADRKLDGDQTVTSGKSAVYGLNAEGKMVQIGETKENLSKLPSKENDPSGKQAVGNIAVYKLDTQLTNSDKPSNYNISGVRISKFKDLYIDQVWNFPEKGMTMPRQDFIAKDNEGKELGKVHVEEGDAGQTTRFVTIPNARYWDIDEKTHEASKRENKIEQKFKEDTVEVGDKTYKYNENANYYQRDTKSQYIQNSAIDITKPNPVTFTVVKVDSNDPSKKLEGAKFKLLGDNQPSIVTDDQGRATFNNVLPGRYTLIEEKAPDGYKLDQSQKTITIAEDGTISVNGSNIQLSGGKNHTKLVQHNSYPNWPDYMNAMHYGKINDNGELEFYLYLKPESNNGGGGTNKNTRLNISIPGVNITDVKAYDVYPSSRQTVKYSMEKQIADQYIPNLGNDVINAANNNKITGTPSKHDPYTGKTGYQIYFPQERFENDWGFLVKVKAKVGDKQSVNLDYDWLTDKDTANETKLTQSVILNKTNGQGEGEENQILVTNEEFTKSPISATKFGDEFDEKGNRKRLQGAEFVLKDSTGRTLANKFTDEKGTANFGQYPPGTYRLEEVQAPDGYIKSNIYFEVVVDEQGQVKYNARFEDGIGKPEAGRDYYIEKGEETGGSNKATVTNVNQRLEYLENEPGDIGVQTGVWEAYRYESLKYHADITLSDSSPNTRFEIQFDRNLDFTQYFSDFPKIVINGEEVADPYFDYNTNLLTYVFNDKSKGGPATASINLRGIIPDKYYAKETRKNPNSYPFTIKVAPGVAGVGGNANMTTNIQADYGPYDSGSGNSNQFYYFRDVYQKEDGNWYVTVMAYLNPMGFSYGSKTTRFNWITTDFQGDVQIARWSGKGYRPLYNLEDVKVYGTDFASYKEDGVWKNPYMPPSLGVRPEQDPNIYHLLAHQRIDPNQGLNIRENDVTINYDPNQIKTDQRIDRNSPLKITTPKPRDNGGYIIEQTFKITDIKQFNKKWRAFHMTDGNLESAFASRANVNTAKGDQSGGEIPKYYKEVIGLINNKYTPGSFKLTKYEEANQGKKLPNATFALTDENGKTIYRSSDANGEVNFKDIAPGRYTLEETRAPEGYQLTNKKWQVTILNDGSVRIRETSVTGAGQLYTGNNINIQVSNKPAGQKFRVYKKDGDGRPLPGAKFKISDPENKDSNFPIYATSDENGIVQFNGTPQEKKNYVLEEVEPPTGYNKLNKKWVLRVEEGKVKIYNYSKNTEGGQKVQSILGAEGAEWVDVKNRNTAGWSNYDNRWTGWTGNNNDARFMGTRIVAINKKENYVIQRYVINPEARNIDKTTASIHRQSTRDPNMDWFDMNKFDKNNDIKVFKLYKPVTGLISDIRLTNYKAEDITSTVTNTATQEAGRYGEPDRLKFNLPATDKPIVIDIKVPYKDANGGVGTGMDWVNGNQIYWKADFYETVSNIKTTGPTTGTTGTILGSYVGEDSLDVTNDAKTYGFKIKKVKEGETDKAIPGAVFKLTGPDNSPNERYMTTGSDGKISFNGLKPGKYKLEEEKPAPGYEKSNTTWTVRVASDGKVYIKDDNKATDPKNPSVTVSTNANTARNNLMRRLQMAGANTELEISGNLVDTLNPLRAGNGWEVVDNASSTQPTKREDASDSDYGQLIDTKIIEIDKENNRYKQVFIYKPGVTAKRNRNIKFHRAYENYNISPNEVTTRVFQVPDGTSLANINESTDIDSIPGKTDISNNVRFKAEGSKKIQTTDINTRYPGTILIEVETNYNENQAIGLGSNYDFNTSSQSAYGHKCWLEKSYANEAGVPVVKTTVNYTITFYGNGGTWKMDPVTVEENTEYELPGSSFIPPDGKEFDGWLVNGVNKNPGDKITVTSDLTIQAQWRNKAPKQATVSFRPGEGSGTMAEQKVNIGSEYTLPPNGFTPPTGKEFKAWNVSEQEKQPGDVITINANVTIKAVWKEKAPETHNVIVEHPDQEGGTITAEPTSATAGTEIKLTVTPKDNYKIVSVTMNGQTLTPYAEGKYKFTMPASNATVSATFKKKPDQPSEDEKEIPSDGFAQITNKQTGLDLKIYKKDRYDRKLEGAIFKIKKTDKNYETFDKDFGVKIGTSNKEGLVEFKDNKGNIINLPVGHYVIEETAAPLGYRKPNAPWKVEVVEENGQLVAKYKGPKETPQSFVEKNENLTIKEENGVRYATKITHIDTESRSFIQRVYIDTRKKQGTVNVQIKPKHKREEIDRAGLPPVTIKEGVKTAYRSTYKISGINGDPDPAQMIKILNDYDVSNPNVTVVNTARWRPFDWGFDEDQLNLEPGVYYIDIEGFYDTSIIDRNVTNEVRINGNYNFIDKNGVETKEPVLKDSYVNNDKDELPDADLGKIDIDIEFYDGAREFQQLYITKNNTIDYKTVKDENGKDEASYQSGAEALRQWLLINRGEPRAKKWAEEKPAGKKYVNPLGKNVTMEGQPYITGKIVPPIETETPSSKISTSMDISSLYSSQKENKVPQEGLNVVNDAERYNITFSKHGKLTDTDSIEEMTKRRLEGAVFKLEKRVREGIYEEVEGSYVSSAFNGYFGFRGLEPGRYRLIEVQAPKGYKPIDGPLLHFSVETVSIVSQRITDPRTGENIDVKKVEFYFPGNNTPYKFEDLEMHDPVTDKVIKFMKAKNADLETTRIINPLDKTKEVPLRDLSIKFPGEIKDKEGKVVKDTYLISEIQITPTSNGYISLEYDKANGVYQYVPETSTTEENGKLVDYVTSATAKNMGKIVNEKPGKGSVTINKVDEHGNALKGTKNEKGELIAGARFRLTNLTDGLTPVEKTVGTDGNLSFDGLKIGNYKLEEIESPDGHINTGQVWHFTVGGKDLDPYSEDIAPTGRDLSGQIKLTESKMNVVSPINKNGAPTVKGEIHPHLGESLVFDNSYKVPEGIKINPGDYFTLKLKDSTDLHGIFENPIDNLDIFADGVGTIAKANYNRAAGTITYTFTKYADTYELKNISNKIAAFINLDVIRQSKNNVPVGFIMNNDYKSSNINVVYDLKTERKNDGRNFINYTSKIVKYNPDTGEFVHYFYINRDRTPTGAFDFNFLSGQNLSNVLVTEYKVLNNLENAMPESFGVDENSNNLGRGRVINSSNYLPAGRELTTPYYNGVTSDGSYIVKVTGKVADEDKSKYVGHSNIIHYYGNGYVLYADRFDAVYQFVNESSAEAKLTIKAINPSNKIKFKKINSKSEALKGAKFQLSKKDNNGNWNYYGQQITTKDDGLIEYSKLPKGEYQLIEITAPQGYVKPDGPLAEFKVDESGKVFRKESYKDEKGQDQVRFIEEPGVVPITLVNNKEHEVVFKKVDAADKKALEGAEFKVLYKNEKTGEYSDKNITLYKDADGNLYALKSDDTPPTGYTKLDTFTSGKDGIVKFKVNEPGFYALKETKAPKGYINPRGIVKEFAVLDDKVQTEQYKTEMDVNKKTGWSMSYDVFQKSYTTNMTLRFNPNHEDITYVKDKSTIKLSDLPLKSEIWDNKFNAKQPIEIEAYLVDNDNKETTKKTYKLDLTKDYATNLKASKIIDLYSLVKELEKENTDGDIKSNKTVVLTMSSSLYLSSELDIKSNIVIGDKIKENRTFHIGTKGDENVDHSYKFTNMEEITSDEPIEIVNRKLSLPFTRGIRAWIGFTIIGLILMILAAYYYNKKKNKALEIEKN
ncbi:hypothetical protein HMPREF3045_08335 [Anaerococcus sp. HMSC075B03]|uniref:SpaA isopeptide-forming pilin-related protein n=1 Tax=Anaerococcus sp. HMSC075B03 TaxID=1739537 RepID=UPI0008A5C26A|nr:SpaA isopeptide-forming pilin-related protein [Anaerococcus sp. HMSC075B03]OFO43271.1 hypothetical protein HMPREF3045_08335 [Anaerococcus sp. HMSC075B03]